MSEAAKVLLASMSKAGTPTLIQRFESIKDAPDAPTKLKRLIVDLAVLGKLTKAEPSDGTAADLLEEIAKQKAPLVGAGQSVRPMAYSGELKDGWCAASVNQLILEIQTGPFGSSLHQSDYRHGGTPVINPASIQNECIMPIDRMAVGPDTLNRLGSFRLRAGDIVLARRGEMGRCAVVNESEAGWLCGTGCIVLRLSPWIDARYMVKLIGSSLVRNHLERAAVGATMQNLNQSILLKTVVPLAPGGEQRRIVAKIDKLGALCDRWATELEARERTRTQLTKASFARVTAPPGETQNATDPARFALNVFGELTARPQQIKEVRQTVFNLAVRGKLSERRADDEPAASVLQRVSQARAALKHQTGDARIKQARAPRPDDLPLSLPEGWGAASFDDLFLFIDYRGNTPPKVANGIPLITAKNVRMGYLNREPREYISEATFKRWMTRGFPRVGDLFFTTEAPLANVCRSDITEPFALAQRVICLQPYCDEIDTRFVMYVLMSDLLQSLINERATGMTAKGIKASNLKPIPIPVPPPAEQKRIVARVDELIALCTRLERELATSASIASKCLDAIIVEALETAKGSTP